MPPVLDIPFDHYQRYAAATHLLQTLGLDQAHVLEVGANRQRLLGQFLPQATFLYTDLHAEGDETDFVVADATALPFIDRQFDAVVSLDVIEHIPAHLRARAIAEMARVADRAVIVGFPPQRAWVEQAEMQANGRWQELFGEDYAWLQEHKELGLVDTDEVMRTFQASGLQVMRFGQGNAGLWASLMGAHFIKVKFPELEGLVQAADRLYNSRVFAGDHSDQPYREYYVAVRSEGDTARLLSNPPFQAASDEEATALLSGLADGLRAIALRALNAEQEWKSTAGMLDAYISDLEVAKREWGATAAHAKWLQAAKDESDAGWVAQHAYSLQALQLAETERVVLVETIAQRDLALGQAAERLQHEQEQAAAHLQQEREHAANHLKHQQEQAAKVLQQIRATHDEDLHILQQRIAKDANAYARSRMKWKWAVLVAGGLGLLTGAAAVWALL